MNLFNHHYRQFDPTLGRFAYMAGEATPQAIAEDVTKTLKPAEAASVAPAALITAEQLNAEIDRAETTIKGAHDKLEATLKKDLLTPKEEDALKALRGDAGKKFVALKAEYSTAAAEAEATRQEKLDAVKGNLSTAITELIGKIGETTDEGATEALTPEEETKAYEILRKQFGLIEGETPKSGPLYEAWIALTQSPDWVELGKKLGIEGDKIQLDEKGTEKMLSFFVATMTPEQMTDAKKTDVLTLRPGQLKEMFDKMKDEISRMTGEKWLEGKVEVTQEENSALTEYLAKNNSGEKPKIHADAQDGIVKYLATRYTVTVKGEGDSKELQIDGKKVENLDGLIVMLPASAQAEINSKEPPTNADKLNAAVAKGTEITEKMAILHEFLDKKMDELTGEKKEDKEKKGSWGDIGALVTAITQLMEAWKTGDWSTMGDALKDMQEGRNVLDEQKKAGDIYAKILETKTPPPTLDMILAAYMNPRGEQANAIFDNAATQLAGEGVTRYTRYRNTVKDAIKKNLEKNLGITLGDVFQESSGLSFNYYKDNVQYKLIVGKATANNQIQITKCSFENDAAGKSITKEGATYQIGATTADIKAFLEPGGENGKTKIKEAPAVEAYKAKIKGEIENGTGVAISAVEIGEKGEMKLSYAKGGNNYRLEVAQSDIPAKNLVKIITIAGESATPGSAYKIDKGNDVANWIKFINSTNLDTDFPGAKVQ